MTNATTKKSALCFAHNHMTFAEYGLYSHLREVSSKNNFIYRFDDRSIAGRFADKRGVSKDSCNRLRNALVDKKFIEWLEPQTRNQFGHIEPRVGRILSHKERAKKYPDACPTCISGSTSTCLKDATGPVSNTGSALSHQLDIKGIELQAEKKPNGMAGATAFPPPSLPLPPGDSTLAPAAQSGAPVSQMIQAVSDTPDATVQADALCSRFQPDKELTYLAPSVQKLASLIEAYVHQPQKTRDLPNLDRLAKVSPSNAEILFNWVVKNPDTFWSTKLSGQTALRFFCNRIITIAQQYNNAQRRSKTTLKAASVAPDPAKPFQYQGETL